MKICIISFDFWNYNKYIVDELLKKGIEANFIDLKQYKYNYPTPFHKIGNFISKTLFKKNIKKIKREQAILERLKQLGKQDQILVVSPELISKETHLQIKKYTNKYITYLFDSVERYPIQHLLNINLFDSIFTFDAEDAKKFNFQKINNYIYFEKKQLKPVSEDKYEVFTISSIDERLEILNRLAIVLDRINISFNFILVGKKKPENLHPKINYLTKRKNQKEVHQLISGSNAILDILRKNQSGLSFRIFEALGFQKKIITTNANIKSYDFYNPNNILVVDAQNPEIPKDFFSKPYEPIPEEVYQEYTLSSWVDTIFNL